MNQEISPVLITGAAGFIGSALAIKLINVFLKTKFEGGRHLRRIKNI